MQEQWVLVLVTNLPVSLFGKDRWQFLFTGLFLAMIWYNLFLSHAFLLMYVFCSGQCHQSEVMQQLARTFLWWFSSFLRPLLAQCHQVALLLQILLPHGSEVYEIVSSTIVCTMEFGTTRLAKFSTENIPFLSFVFTVLRLCAEPKNRQFTNGLGANFISNESAAAFVCFVVFTLPSYNGACTVSCNQKNM